VNVRELRSQAKARKIPKYYKLGKAQLLSALGMSAEAKAHKSQTTRRKAIAFNASKEGGDSSVKKALVKGRILRSVKRGLVAEEKKQGRKLTQEEKRTVATKALASEVKAIRSGTPESKPKRGNGQKMTKATKSLTPDQHKQVAIDVKRIKESDRQGWIADGMAKGDETMLRSQARQRMLNHSRSGLFQDFKTHENAVVAAFKSKDPTPTAKRGIVAFKRKPMPEIEPPIELDKKGKSIGFRELHEKGWESLGSHNDLQNEVTTETWRDPNGKKVQLYRAYGNGSGARYFGTKQSKPEPKPEPVEQKIKLEDVKTPSDRAKYAKQEAAHQRSQGNEKAAKAWDDKAKEGRKAAISRDTIASTQSQTNLFGVTDHASDMPLFGGHQEEPAKKPVSETKEPRGLQEVSPHDLHFDPKRFQYKLVHGETGASGSLTDVRKWDENLGGVMLVWRDPKDGKDYVVNGHNRNTLARKLGAEKVAVRYLPVDTPKEARVIGALANMSEGSGNALDAAKFLRDTGMNREQLEEKGIPMKQKVATDGLALSKLAPHLFDKVVQGDIPIERATLIGDRIHDHDNQAKLVDLIDKAQSKGRKITNDVVRELADTVQSAPSHTETQFDLFGASETTQNLALEKAELTAHVRSRLSREKKLFGLVSKSKAASELERGGNTIDTEKSKGISDQASQVLGVFDQLKNQSGPVSSAINKAVERIANGDNQKQVQDDLHKQLLTEIPQALGIRSRSDSDSIQAATGRSGEGQKRLRVKKS